jgi:hypothetical protein
MDKDAVITKSFNMTAEVEEDEIKGIASVTGVIDRGGDVMFPGVWKSTIAEFKKSGFGALSHDRRANPIIMPTSTEEKGNQLLVAGKFHSTPSAQETKTVCKERIENGLEVGLSVGFIPDWQKGIHYFENGAKLLKFAEENGYDMKLFDVAQIKACKTYCRGITAVKKLAEWSIAIIPMNQYSMATSVKSDEGSEKFDVMGWVEQFKDGELSGEDLTTLKAVNDKLQELLKSLPDSDTDETPAEEVGKTDDDKELQEKQLKIRILDMRMKTQMIGQR